jgi:hypothetical protein
VVAHRDNLLVDRCICQQAVTYDITATCPWPGWSVKKAIDRISLALILYSFGKPESLPTDCGILGETIAPLGYKFRDPG